MSAVGGGQTLVSEGDTGAAGPFLLVLGAVLAVAGAAMLIAGIATGSIGLGIGGAVMALIGVAVTAGGVGQVRKARRLDPGVLDVAAPSLYLSSTTPCRFRRRIKRGSRTATDLRARLVLQEWVRYTVGTDTRTATHDVLTTPVPITPVPDPDGITGELTLHLPAYPPTFEASNNAVRWRLIVEFTLDDGFSEDSIIPLPVAPAVLVDWEA